MQDTFETIESLESLPVRFQYLSETIRDGNWKCDQWRVTISSRAGFYSFDYFTGLGHRKSTKPKPPKVADVLHSLILDASAADENFHDWCANYGYSDDSIKALNMYKHCLETASALRRHFSHDTLHRVRELLQDY